MANEIEPDMYRLSRPLSYFDDNFVAPLASMEDLSVLMTPMSTPGPTPGPSPKTRARWSHRMSSGNMFDPLPPINDDVELELPVQNGRSLEKLSGNNSLLKKSFANNRKTYPACPCMLQHEEEGGGGESQKNISPPQEKKNAFFGNGGHHHHHLELSRKKSPVNRLASPVWRPSDVIDVDERRRILDDSDYPFVRPRDVQTSLDDVDDDDNFKRRFLDDSQSPFLKPRQVTFLHSSPKSQRHKTSRVTSEVGSAQTSPVARRESASHSLTSHRDASLRASPEFSSMIRANGGSLKPEAMKPPIDRF